MEGIVLGSNYGAEYVRKTVDIIPWFGSGFLAVLRFNIGTYRQHHLTDKKSSADEMDSVIYHCTDLSLTRAYLLSFLYK